MTLPPSLEHLAQQVRILGRELSPQVLAASEALWSDAGMRAPIDVNRVDRDQRYGPHERHRLDVYGSRDAAASPVLLFVHGGGFTGGDKHKPGSYQFDNVGHWAASQGMLGIAMTYRLAPMAGWPAAAEDVGAAVQWTMDHAAEYGGDPDHIVLAGHSAGAAHVADYLTAARLNAGHRDAVRGAVLISGVYDLGSMGHRPSVQAYYGSDDAQAGRSSIHRVAQIHCPLFITAAQEDPWEFQDQALRFAAAYGQAHGKLPRFSVVCDHNHYSTVLHIGSADTRFTSQIAGFVSRPAQ